MCIAIASPAATTNNGLVITEKTLERCFDGNPDGAGFAYGDQGKVIIEKGFFSFKEFYEAFQPHKEKQTLIHFRIKTHGAKSKEMCHPFMINDHIAMIHNGIINGHGKGDVSDTAEFVAEVIIPVVERNGDAVLKDPVFQKLVEKYIGYSKLMFLNVLTDEFTVYNMSMCNENSGIIFSNFSWQESKFPVTTGYTPPWMNDEYWSGHSHKKTKEKTSVIRMEIPCLMRATYGKALRFEKSDFIRVEGGSSSDSSGAVKGDICIIEKIWNDGKVDVYNFTQDRQMQGLPSWRCDSPTEADLAMISQ